VLPAELLASVDDAALDDDDDTWPAEVRRRAARAHRGDSPALPWEDVKRDVLARLRGR
jgi:Putative addiction module component